MKTIHVYNGIYYAVATGNQFQSCIGMLNFISCVYIYIVSLGGKSIQIKGSFWFKVTNSPVYLIKREVIKEFDSLKSKI